MKRVLILGATSAIAEETARLFASKGDRICLVGRRPERLAEIAADLRVRGAPQVETLVSDLNETERHGALIDGAAEALGGLDTALLAHGTLGDQAASQADWTVAASEIHTNFLSAASLLTLLANRFEAQRHGAVAVISSVAGDRGRQSNYVYGAAKAGLTTFTDGVRNRLAPLGITVVTVKPGFVDTPMTAHLPKGPLFVKPDVVARSIHRALAKGGNVLYTPWFWRFIMAIIKAVPEAIFKKLKL
ncbi:SDR family oxidoreductase [Vulgatibacter sp.]|uniref:SDR family oxidoreductase n=1 Tax=Vulgatibacter sp. TaxID=1971226 RepID=UPI00356B4428